MALDDFLEDESQDTTTETMTEESQGKADDATQGEADEAKVEDDGDVKGDKTAPPAEGKAEEPNVDDKKVPLSAVLDERHKRQAAERELERLRAQGDKPQTEPEKKDFFEDPDTRLKEMENRFQAQIVEAQAKIRLDISEEMMRKSDADYDRKRELFLKAADADPNLVRAMMAARNPAEWVVEFAEAYDLHSTLKGVKSVKALKDQLREEVRKELEADGKLPPTAQNGRQVPETLTNVPGAAPSGKPSAESAEPDDFDDILGKKRK